MTITVLTIAIGATASTMVTTTALNRTSRDTQVARMAAENMIEVLRAVAFDDVFATYNGSTADDPGGVGTAPGRTFDVPGLTPMAGAPGGRAGEIFFPGAGPALLENVADATLDMPRDLDGDGSIDGSDHAGDYLVIPVRVRIRWKGTGGERFVELQTLLSAL